MSIRAPGDPLSQIGVATNLVTMPVSVLDRDGRFIAGLKKKDFQIFEDGVPQTIDQFERMGAGPSLGYWPWFLLAQPAPFPEGALQFLLVARMLSAHPRLTPYQVKSVLRSAGTPTWHSRARSNRQRHAA